MLTTVEARLPEIAEACHRFHVERLELFGSAARSGMTGVPRDLDFLVSFKPEARQQAFDNFFGLRESLERLFGRPIDLVTEKSLRNPYLIRTIDRDRRLVYAA